MNIILSNLPPDVDPKEIRDFLTPYGSIIRVYLTNEGNPDQMIATVFMDVNRTTAKAIKKKLHNKLWKGRTISIYIPLFFTGER